MIYVNHEDFISKMGTFPDELLKHIRESIRNKYEHVYEVGDVASFIAMSLLMDIMMNLRPHARPEFIKSLHDNMQIVMNEMKEREAKNAIDPS